MRHSFWVLPLLKWSAAIAAPLLLLAWCSGSFDPHPESETFRYKLTINVRVNGQLHSASSVIEATQKRGRCLAWLFPSGSGASGTFCTPRFSAKGVSPIIELSSGAVIYASVNGYTGSRNLQSGLNLGLLPWVIYLQDWNLGPENPMALLPSNLSRVEIQFDNVVQKGLPKKPVIWWVPPQRLGPARGTPISNKNANEVSGHKISLVSFALEPSTLPLKECLENGPSWLVSYRGGATVPKEASDFRKYSREQPIDMKLGIYGFETGGDQCK